MTQELRMRMLHVPVVGASYRDRGTCMYTFMYTTHSSAERKSRTRGAEEEDLLSRVA